MNIDILVPTLGRPDALRPLADNIAETTPEDAYRLVFILDRGDEASFDAVRDLREPLIKRKDGTYPEKINAGLKATRNELVLPTADDVVFHDGWYENMLKAFEPWVEVLGTRDLSPITEWGEHSTMPIVRRHYIETVGAAHGETGTVFHEGYHHNAVETETCQLAQHRRVWKFSHDVVIEHCHPAWGTREPDDTDRKGNMRFREEDMALFEQRRDQWLKL